MSLRITEQALEDITDAGLFEKLATDVLREANPIYRALVHTGVNATGKPIKSPVDGICFVKGANPPHMVAVHHATTSYKDLEKKWLHNPSTVKPRKGSKPTVPAGDLIKTVEIVKQEREHTADLRVTLILTTNTEPNEKLVRNVEAAGRTYDIAIDIWSRSRLSHFLDYQPTGQWIRRKFLNIAQEQLSPELLHELSTKSLAIQKDKLLDDPTTWIPRQLDNLLSNALNRNMTFLVAGSGLGKSVACFRQLVTHIESGGFGLVLTHETVASSLTLEQAVTLELQQLYPSLAITSPTPFSFCSLDKPLLLVVEDINRSGRAQALLEKLASWSRSSEENQRNSSYWRILCPLWPEIFSALPTQIRKHIQSLAVITDGFTDCEGRDAVLARTHLDNQSISPLEAAEIAHKLGNDPLLIALHNQEKTPNASQIIEQFFDDCLNEIRKTNKDYFASSYRQTIRALGSEMLSRRKINPSINEVSTWERLQGQHLQLLSLLAEHGKFIRAIGSSENQRLVFRHDRVREWLLTDAAVHLENQNLLSKEIIAEPYFAEIMGMVLVGQNPNSSLLKRIASVNPLALFQTLRLIGETKHPNRDTILQVINNWLMEPTTNEPSNFHLRLEALAILSETDAAEVPEIASKLQTNSFNAAIAQFRNGDVLGGIYLCSVLDPGCHSSWRDSQIDHAKIKYGNLLIRVLAKILQGENLSSQVRIGALRLCGHLADPSLAISIEISWNTDDDRLNHLDAYLWAFAQCCADEPTRFLEPVCNAWASLPDQPEKEGHSSPRNSLAAYRLRWAFRKWPPHSAIDYFIQRGAQEDLRWPITYMLHGMDHPKAIKFVVNEFAAINKQTETDSIPIMILEQDWQRAQESGNPMSKESRNLLLSIWQDSANDIHLKSQAFNFWAATQDSEDLEILRRAKHSNTLADNVLRQRLIRGDTQAVPELIEKLEEDEKGLWWQYGRHIRASELLEAVDQALNRRRNLSKNIWFEYLDLDWIIYRLILRMKPDDAERILLEHWDHLRFNSEYVQTAMYIGTSRLMELVDDSINECPQPDKLLEYLSYCFGVKFSENPGVRSEAQLRALAPYIHLLSSMCIGHFWEECNDRGWFTLRRELFDDLLQSPHLQFKWEPSKAGASLDEMLEDEQFFRLEHWIDNFLKIDVSWSEILSTILIWAEEKRSLQSLKVLAYAIKYRGSRKDLSVLEVCEGISKPAFTQLIADTEFAVKRRNLV